MIQTDSSFFFTKLNTQNLQCYNIQSYKLRHNTKLNENIENKYISQKRFKTICDNKLNNTSQILSKSYKSIQQENLIQLNKETTPKIQRTPLKKNTLKNNDKELHQSNNSINSYLAYLKLNKNKQNPVQLFTKKLEIAHQTQPEQPKIQKLQSLKSQIQEKIMSKSKSNGQVKLFSITSMLSLQKNVQKRRLTLDLTNAKNYTDPDYYDQLVQFRQFFHTLFNNLIMMKENKKKWEYVVNRIPGFTSQIQHFLFDQSNCTFKFKDPEEMYNKFIQEQFNFENISNQSDFIQQLKDCQFLKKLTYFGDSVQIMIDERFKVRVNQKIEEKNHLHKAIIENLSKTKFQDRQKLEICIPQKMKEPFPSLSKTIKLISRKNNMRYISPMEIRKNEMYDKEEQQLYELRNEIQ